MNHLPPPCTSSCGLGRHFERISAWRCSDPPLRWATATSRRPPWFHPSAELPGRSVPHVAVPALRGTLRTPDRASQHPTHSMNDDLAPPGCSPPAPQAPQCPWISMQPAVPREVCQKIKARLNELSAVLNPMSFLLSHDPRPLTGTGHAIPRSSSQARHGLPPQRDRGPAMMDCADAQDRIHGSHGSLQREAKAPKRELSARQMA